MPQHSVLAIFVAYNPDFGLLSDTVQSVLEQGCDCYIVDNASKPALQLAFDASRVTVDYQQQNLGLGAAQNIGIRAAQSAGYEYVILFDQDSCPNVGMIAALLRAYQQKARLMKVAAVGPVYANPQGASESFFIRFGALKFQRVYKSQADELGCISADFLISSGSLVSTAIFDEVGLLDETLFIDHVDTEWFLRARALGYHSFGVAEASMRHALGESTHTIKFAGRERTVPQHKPFRYYYIFRNSVLLYRRHGLSGLWKWNDIQRLMQIFFMFAVLRPPRLANFRMMAKGVLHGLLGRSGKLDEPVASSGGQ